MITFPEIVLNPLSVSGKMITLYPEFSSFITSVGSSEKKRAYIFSISNLTNGLDGKNVNGAICSMLVSVTCDIAGGGACYPSEYCAGSSLLEYQFSTAGRRKAAANRSSVAFD